MTASISGTNILVADEMGGFATNATFAGVTPPTTASTFAIGCRLVNRDTGVAFTNTGTVAAPVWTSDLPITGAVTATADGLTTGLIIDSMCFVTVTSAAATNAITLPAASAAYIGRQIDIHVGANGYELLTPATGNNTINTVDSDGTNQLDVAANTLLRCVQVTATGWVAYQVTATTITVVAPDND